jgi:Ca2+/H+ antiporter, TMEM165/GDT1 family
LTDEWMRWILAASFLSVANGLYALQGRRKHRRTGASLTTLAAFFFAEIGDERRSPPSLAARFERFYAVVISTTCGMMLANIAAVPIGHRLADGLPVRAIGIAVLTLAGTGG